ncbi:plasmid mobilization relaxosome protein MobC [Streptomyces sp. NPDC056600]|uniref:plasmid mobilization relaxosome protein MobC n=1 Tax=Streptomyces sp. NPDC056600 TaxID=3345874 RepID=UPI0036A6B3D8
MESSPAAGNDIAPLPASDTEQLRRFQDADTALNRIGNNLTQIARAVNAGQEVPRQQLAALVQRVVEAAPTLMEAGADIARSRVHR